MEKILEHIECYVILQALCGNCYQTEMYDIKLVDHSTTLILSRDIRRPNCQELFIKIYFYDKSIFLELLLDERTEKKKIKKVNKFFDKNKQNDWIAIKYFTDIKYNMRFFSEDELLDFLKKYALKG
ncbi:MAG: hypothetical protein K0R18_21 [Bacillales bacterium]|nr:hypothetical protein [Bacillales bacterium]